MKGTRQGDFSRLLFDRRKNYSAVHLQQGRVQLDSDWNAQVELARHRQETETADVIGRAAAPSDNAGFGIEVASCLELGPGKHFVVIGGNEGCQWPTASAETSELTLEAQLIPRGNGVLFSRWARREGELQLADQLELADGKLRYFRSGQPEIESLPVDLLGKICHLAVVSRQDGTVLYLDGEAVAEGTSSIPPRGLANNIFLIAASLQGNRAVGQLDCLWFDFRVWDQPRTADQVRHGIDRPPPAESSLVGWWAFTDGQGVRVRDHSTHCNHGIVRGSTESPKWRPYRATISAGRFYIDGLLCENPETVGFEHQGDDPGVEFPRRPGFFLFYLDAWEREVSAVEDPALREIALGGPDTTTRSRTIAQVKVLELASPPAERHVQDCPEWRRLLAAESQRGKLRAQFRAVAGSELGNDLYRVEIHHGGACLGGPWPVDGDHGMAAQVSDDGRVLQLAADSPQLPSDCRWAPGQPLEVRAADSADGGEVAVLESVEANGKWRLEAAVKLRGEARVRCLATLKWSRQNASHSFPIAGLESEGKVVKIGASARGIDLCAGAWVEVLDDAVVLRRQTRHLCQVESVDTTQNTIYLRQAPPVGAGTKPALHPLLRYWNQTAEQASLLPSGVAVARAGWQNLEEGIQLQFVGDAVYRSGDYWVVPARQLAQDIEWPRHSNEPLAQEPHGVEHLYAPLALLAHGDGGFRLDDLRRTFQPLATGAVSKAGDEMEGDLLIRAGLDVSDDLEVRGQARIGQIYGRLCGQDMVDTPQLVDDAVTRRKLAPEVGVVPEGFSILGPSPSPPPGYVATDCRLTLTTDHPRWVDRLEIPSSASGPHVSAAVDGKVYTLLEAGDLWIYDPVGPTWSRGRELPQRRQRFAMAAVADKLHVVGGVNAVGTCLDEHWIYDPAADDWRQGEPMPTPRFDLALATFGGRLHALGGLRRVPLLGWLLGHYASRRHEVYDPATDSWHRRCPMPQAHYALAAAGSGNAIHAVGGQRRWLLRLWGRIRSHRHQLYHVGSDRWMERTRLPSPRSDLALVEAGGRLYAVGGRGPGWLTDCDRYDPGIDHWEPQAPLHEAIEAPGVAAVDGALYVTGARRFPDAAGVLVEECRVATVLHVHRRDFAAGLEATPREIAGGQIAEPGPPLHEASAREPIDQGAIAGETEPGEAGLEEL